MHAHAHACAHISIMDIEGTTFLGTPHIRHKLYLQTPYKFIWNNFKLLGLHTFLIISKLVSS